MNKVAWSAILVSVAGFALVAAGPGCNSSSPSGNTGDDASTDTGTGSSSSSSGGSSSGSTMDSSVMDSTAMDSSMASETSTDGGVCPAPSTGSMACDTCIDNSCHAQWCTCAADTTVDDAGQATGGCSAFVQCVDVCANGNADAGLGCIATCEAADGGMAYTQTDTTDGIALLQCIQSMCTTPTQEDGGEAGAPPCQ